MDFSRLNRREIWMKTPNNASNRVPFCLVDGKTAARGRQLRRFVSDAQLFCSRGWDRNQVDRRFFESQFFSVIPKCLSPELLPSFPYTFPLFGIHFCSGNLAGATREKIFLFLFFNFHIFFEEMSILWTKSFFLGENSFQFHARVFFSYSFFLIFTSRTWDPWSWWWIRCIFIFLADLLLLRLSPFLLLLI